MKSDLSLPHHVASRRPVDLANAAGLLPLWLVALATTVEGFPRPPISLPLAVAALALAIGVSLLALWKRWTTVELVLVSFFPLLLLPIFDEISTAYKTPFILLCALVLTAGILLYQRSRAVRWRWLVLLAAAGLAWLLAWNATLNYWQMAAELGYERCLPDAAGCAPLAGRGRPWWALFLAP